MVDIVERLQERGKQADRFPKRGDSEVTHIITERQAALALLCKEAADTIDRQREEIERLRAAVIKLCDEFEDATYDTNSGGQSADRKNLIAECRRAALEEDGRE